MKPQAFDCAGLGHALKVARAQRKLTQAKAAVEIGVSIPTLSYIESGLYSITLDTYIRCCSWLGIELPFTCGRIYQVKP